MLQEECKAVCDNCIEYSNPNGDILFKCNDDKSKDKVVIIASSVVGGIALITLIYVTVLIVRHCKKKRKALEMKINHITPNFETYFHMQAAANKNINDDSKEIDAVPVQARIEKEEGQHTNQMLILNINNQNNSLADASKVDNAKNRRQSKVFFGTVLKGQWKYNAGSPEKSKNGKKLIKSLSPNKKLNIARNRRRSQFIDNNNIGQMVDNIMKRTDRE